MFSTKNWRMLHLLERKRNHKQNKLILQYIVQAQILVIAFTSIECSTDVVKLSFKVYNYMY